jgi:hypothetical protein
MRLWHNQVMPRMQSACDNAVGARKEWFTITKASCPSAVFDMSEVHITEESVALFQVPSRY